MISSNSNGKPPLIFFIILIAYGAILITGGLRRGSFLFESGRLPRLLKRLFMLSSEETLGGIIATITGLLGLFLITKL
ncbi:MAG TPA: hypothetical protein VGJ93_02105 [Desulfuromonadaceae bacterium]|jgi:hypothetical protein